MYRRDTEEIRDLVYESVKSTVSLDSSLNSLRWGGIRERLRQKQEKENPIWEVSADQVSALRVEYTAESEDGNYVLSGEVKGTMEDLDQF